MLGSVAHYKKKALGLSMPEPWWELSEVLQAILSNSES